MNLSFLPNAISALRIALVPPILYAIAVHAYGLAVVLFVVAGFSDGIDGYLAQRFGWHSRLGGLLDPAADKLLVAGLFVALTLQSLVPLWLMAVVLFRDVVIVGGALAYNFLVRPVPGEPSRISKLNTAIVMLYLLFVLGRAAVGWPAEISVTVLGATVLVTSVISGTDYVIAWSERARQRI